MTIQIARRLRLTLNRRGEWRAEYAYGNDSDWGSMFLCNEIKYALDYAVLHLKDAEAIAVVFMTNYHTRRIRKYDMEALERVVKEANELWTFK